MGSGAAAVLKCPEPAAAIEGSGTLAAGAGAENGCTKCGIAAGHAVPNATGRGAMSEPVAAADAAGD